MWSRQAKFSALVEAYSADLYRFAFWLSRSEETAQDLVQETFTRAWRFLDGLRDEKAGKAWLFTTLRREFARLHERRKLEIEAFPVEAIADPRAGLDTRPETMALRQALGKLPGTYLEPLLLQVIGGYSCEEIAAALEISTNAVTTRLFRARQKLRETLETKEDLSEVSAK